MSTEGIEQEQKSTVPDWQTLLSAKTSENSRSKIATIQSALTSLIVPGQVVELRVLGVGGRRRIDSGYFEGLDKLAKSASGYDGRAEGVYITLNPINPTLIARANCRVKEYAEHTTADNDILSRLNLPIDFDPIRPAGISSTTEEHEAALSRAWVCRAWLSECHWPEPVFASSGNGAHLIYAIDLPNDPVSAEMVKTCLLALSERFSDEKVRVDTSTGNASRIFKLYGTMACKGDHTAERPHRRATILAAPAKREVVGFDLLNSLAAHATKPQNRGDKPHASRVTTHQSHSYSQAALDREIATLSHTGDGNRNSQLFKSAAALFGLVASGELRREDTYQALLDAALQIGLAESEARRTIESGEKRGMSKPREVPEPQARTKTSDKPQQNNPAPPFLMHVDDLDSLPPIRWLIKDILPADNLVEVHGAPGVGKTQVVFDIAQSLAASGRTVIYVVAEGLQGYRGRKRAWQQFHKANGGNLFIWSRAVHLFERMAVQIFIDGIRAKTPALIVFDTLSRCSLGADENNQKDMNLILEALDTIRRETGATVIAIHHTNAAGMRERGSTVIRGGMDVMIEIAKEDDLVVVTCSKMKDAADFETIYLKPVLVNIGEENSVPVLIRAEKRTQTAFDRLTPLQLEILKVVGMDMFIESGVKSNQLDDILPSGTRRASKYHGLNTLIRLGYVKPHIKGDPYYITEEGRLKLSNSETASLAGKSNTSKTSPSLSIWTLG